MMMTTITRQSGICQVWEVAISGSVIGRRAVRLVRLDTSISTMIGFGYAWQQILGFETIFCRYTLWLFNIAMENGPFIDGLPIKNCDFP